MTQGWEYRTVRVDYWRLTVYLIAVLILGAVEDIIGSSIVLFITALLSIIVVYKQVNDWKKD